jgi:hypothetical protein
LENESKHIFIASSSLNNSPYVCFKSFLLLGTVPVLFLSNETVIFQTITAELGIVEGIAFGKLEE